MRRDSKVYLNDVLESILAIEEYTKSLTEEEFNSNRQVQDAVVRRLEIIGEAVKCLDEEFKNKHSEIPWKKIAGMRDILIHGYFGVNIKRVWIVLKKDLPELKQRLSSLYKK